MPLNTLAERSVLQVKERIHLALPGQPVELRVFGSVARGEATEDSDVDLLVLLDWRTVESDNVIHNIIYDVFMESNFQVFIVPLIISRDQFADLLDRERLLARSIESEGILV